MLAVEVGYLFESYFDYNTSIIFRYNTYFNLIGDR